MEMQDLDKSSTSDIWELVKNLVIVIIVIVALLLISYFISKLLTKKFEFADKLDLGKKDIPGNLVLNSTQATGIAVNVDSTMSASGTTVTPTPVAPTLVAPTLVAPTLVAPVVPIHVAELPVANKTNISFPVHDITGTCHVPVTTYEKYQKITNPASISEPTGYIGRDQVCYRNKNGDFDFVKRRYGCMACQVDHDKNKKHSYDRTGTNVISTCVYADKADLEHGIWDEKMCKEQCEKLKDSM